MCQLHSGVEKSLEAICSKVDLIGQRIELQISMLEKATLVAKGEMERRLEGMNEFREQLTTQAFSFVSKKEVELKLEKLDIKIDGLVTALAERKGSSKWSEYIVTVLISGVVFLVIRFFFKV